MTKTVIGTYSDLKGAADVVDTLVNDNLQSNAISVLAHDPDQRYARHVNQDAGAGDTSRREDVGAAIGGLRGRLRGLREVDIPGIGPAIAAGPLSSTIDSGQRDATRDTIVDALVNMGVPEASAQVYAESVRRGHALVAAQVADNRVDETLRDMRHANLINLEREAEKWRTDGWRGFSTGARSGAPTTVRRGGDRDDETIEVIEEDLQVGKRTREGGGVRVSSHIREVPVEEEVHLREEHVEVERRPVDRPATEADLRGFRDETIEVTETQEEAVVGKEARVVEEIHVHKDVEEHTETVRDTVRRTEVDIEPLGGRSRADIGTDRGFVAYESDYRTHHGGAFSSAGSYDRYQPAYYYGYTLATSDRYQGRNWREVEPEAHKAWNDRNPNTWDQFKDAVHYGWERARGKAVE